MGKPKKPATKATVRKKKERRDWKTKFLAALRIDGTVVRACRAASIEKTTAYRARDKDPKFADSWDEAIDESTQELESEAYRRAKGFQKSIMTKAGIAVVDDYSDTMMIFLLKARKPEKYREPRGDINVTIAPPTVPDHVAKAALEAAQLAADGGKDLGPTD